MSVAASPPTADGHAPPGLPAAGAVPYSAPCPLCGAPLHSEQDWCLRCGAAARTRLAASPNWKAPIVALAAVIALSLGVLAAALVKLAGGSGKAPAAITRTVTAAQASSSTPAGVGSAAGSTPGSLVTRANAPGATAPGTSSATAPTGAATAPFTSPSAVVGRKAILPAGVPAGKGRRVLSPSVERLLRKLGQRRGAAK